MVLNAYFCYFRLQRATFCSKTVNKKKLYSSTILLPKTKFPLRLGKKEVVERDININNSAAFQTLYSWQRKHIKGEEFVLHDGPPYANGTAHMGHAINKILKDAILRHHILQGRKVHYVPGWDCHGLPIELKVLTKINEHIEPEKIRKRARNFAMEAAQNQKAAFKSWGVMGDWENAYFTCDANYVKNQMEQFYRLFERGLVFRDYKPVYWSPSSRTALAEAELEYNPNHKSSAITLRILLNRVPEVLNKYKEKGIYALIWTTTPWSLISNQAVCYNPNLTYSVVQKPQEETVYIIAAELLDSLSVKLKCNLRVLETISGKQLESSTYFHPIYKEKVLPLLPAAHATLKGTGLVHTAPAHGPEDFLVALENKLPVVCMVDEAGCYTVEAGDSLKGKFVLNDGNTKILEMVAKDVVHEETFVHSYPYDWRTKQPVILRASRQWFVNTDAIKSKADESLKDVQILPKISAENHKNSLISQLQKRPYWCISRQRKWGVPIPVFYKNENGEAVIKKETIAHLTALLDKYGTDFWWTLPLRELLPSSLDLKETDVKKGEDIFDIWFDSGISWSSVLSSKSADLYLEGSDQFTGWFQSSLMTSVALQNKSPCKAIYVHGFAVDQKGLKMSKSVGNVVNPTDVVQGKNGQNAWGVDTLRWWVTCHANQDALIPVSQTILQTSFDELQKIRTVLRFALGAINNYQFREISYENLTLLDRCLLHLLSDFQLQAKAYAKDYQFNKIAALVLNFAANSLSSVYFTAIKDRLYCDHQDSKRRLSAQYTLFIVLNIVTRAVAPMVPHLAEEIYSHLPQRQTDSFFKDLQVYIKQEWRNEYLNKLLEIVLDIKSEINKEFGSETLGIGINVRLPLIVFRNLSDITAAETDLADIFQVAHVQLEENAGFPEEFSWTSCKSCLHLCNRCRRVTSDVPDELCERCKVVVESVSKSAAVN